MNAIGDDASVDIATMLANDLRSGTLHGWVRRAANVFERGMDDETAVEQATLAFALRLLLEEVCMRTNAPLLIDALACADESLGGCGGAVMLIDDARYVALTREQPVDETAWWGRRAASEAELPVVDVEAELAGLRAAAPAEVITFPGVSRATDDAEGFFLAAAADADVGSLLRELCTCGDEDLREQFEKTMGALAEVPCPWLRTDLREASRALGEPEVAARLGWRAGALREAMSASPGRVPLLLYLPELHRGLVAELRLSKSCDGLWSHATTLLPLARDALRVAHAAAASIALSAQPRFLLEEHTVRIIGPRRALEQMRAVDGASLALPAAIAFLSLWLGQQPADDVAATGGLETEGGVVRVRPVGPAGLRAKADALATWSKGSAVRLLVHADSHVDVGAPSVGVRTVRELRDAMRQAGLALDATSAWSALGDEAARVSALERHIHELRTQQLDAHHIDGHSPWAVLGDRMQLLIRSLEASHGDLRHRARAYAALAYTHAGDTSAAQALAGATSIDEDTPPPVAALVHLANMVRAIGQEDFAQCELLGKRLEETLPTLRTDERRALFGVVKGTLGRAKLHDTRLPATERLTGAIMLLQEAVDHHVRHQPIEAARSRVYLAMALRGAGRVDEAREELTTAEAELEEHTKPWSGTYYAATRMYLDYERARCAVDAGDQETAVRAGRRALDACDGRGYWPSIGILRTLAWAHRSRGDATAANACVERIERLALGVPAAMRAMMDRIRDEARGLPRKDGEVY